MIPLRLTLKNFMCYGENVPTLRFDSIHVACLCGDNGHGKTALLDAVTWALWGTARATPTSTGNINSINQDELVHLGKSDMSVELDFMAKGQRYRVIRRRSVGARGRNPRSTLELQIAEDADGGAGAPAKYRAISGSAIRDTNRRITEILNMDFKTFVNTAYLAQGQADLFTTSTPTERKTCLAAVLDMAYYARLSERANNRSKEIHARMQANRAAIDVRKADAARRPEYERLLANARQRIADAKPKAAKQRREADRLRSEAQALEARQREFEGLARRVAAAEKDAATLRRQLNADESGAAAYSAVIADADEIQNGFAALQRWQDERARLDAALSRKSELDGKRAHAAQAIALEAQRLSSAQQTLQSRIANELEPRVKRLPAIEREIAALDGRRAALNELAADIERKRADANALTEQALALKQHNAHLYEQMQDTRKKYDMLADGDAACPLCNQRLSDAAARRLRSEYERAGMTGRAEYTRNNANIERLERQRKTIADEQYKLERRKSDDERMLTRTGANLERDRQDAIDARQALEQAAADLERATQAIADKAFARQERRALAEIDGALAELAYDAGAHRQARERVGALDKFAEKRRRLQEAQANLPRLRESLETNRQMLANRSAEIAEGSKRIAEMEGLLAALPALTAALRDAETSRDALESALRQAEVEQGVQADNLARCDQIDAEIRDLERRHRELADEKGIYDELTLAFGKNGIQALIIESAIPQLQDDANEILGRLTEYQMHLRLELDEGTSERLEIRIADALGTRDYKTFSGGEAFRIDFALRIALSRLLARRSGAPLPVLFIDEGFGSQDRSGQERMTEAIQSIQDDFEKIIVITHIERMKDAFPVRIEVSKNGGGSTFAIT